MASNRQALRRFTIEVPLPLNSRNGELTEAGVFKLVLVRKALQQLCDKFQGEILEEPTK